MFPFSADKYCSDKDPLDNQEGSETDVNESALLLHCSSSFQRLVVTAARKLGHNNVGDSLSCILMAR